MLAELLKAMNESGKNYGTIMSSAGLTHTTWNNWNKKKPQDPKISHLEAVALTLEKKLKVSLSDPTASVRSNTEEEEDNLTDEALQLAQLFDEHFPEGSPQRAEVFGVAKGSILGARATAHRPLEPVGGKGSPRDRRR